MKELKITINGTGFAGEFTASVYGMIPHRNGVSLNLSGVCSGHLENARKFSRSHGVPSVFEEHEAMIREVHPDIDNIACINHAHGGYTIESARGGVPVIVLEKPPVIWPGYPEGREAPAKVRKEESMEYLGTVLDEVRKSGSRLLYAENFVYVDGITGIVEILREASKLKKGKVLYQTGVCAHQGSHSPAYDTPSLSGGGALFNKACHPLGPILYLKEIEGILLEGAPVRPRRVSAVARQVMKHQPESSGEHFRVMRNVDDYGRITVVFDDETVAEVTGHDLSISGIRNELRVITDHSQYDIRINPNDANELFLPKNEYAGDRVLREKLPTAEGTSFPSPRQFYMHGYVGEMSDAVACALEPDRAPQSGPMLAWDTMAVLMAAYESDGNDSSFVDISEYIDGRSFERPELPDPEKRGEVFL